GWAFPCRRSSGWAGACVAGPAPSGQRGPPRGRPGLLEGRLGVPAARLDSRSWRVPPSGGRALARVLGTRYRIDHPPPRPQLPGAAGRRRPLQGAVQPDEDERDELGDQEPEVRRLGAGLEDQQELVQEDEDRPEGDADHEGRAERLAPAVAGGSPEEDC